MARASTYTLLSLDRYAKIMQINPVRFNGGDEITITDGSIIFPRYNDVQGIWPQYGYQTSDAIGREDIATQINVAEKDIAAYLGWFPAPVWLEQEQHTYPRNLRPDVFGNGLTQRGYYKSIKAKYAKFISSGQRAVTLIQNVAITYTDVDLDGFKETATITAATTLTDLKEIKVYVPGKNGAKIWEIRDPKSVTISGGNFIAVYNTWQMIDPDAWEQFPTNENNGSAAGIDITNPANLLTRADVYREYNDYTATAATFMWEHLASEPIFCTVCQGAGCSACAYDTQDGCLHARDVDNGMVVPTPATYDTDSAQWVMDSWSLCREPDLVKIYYRSGAMDEDYINGTSYEPLSNFFAQIIAYMATARLERSFAANNNVMLFANTLMRDKTLQQPDGNSFFLDEGSRANPFGTRVGEIYAWKQLRNFVEDRVPHTVGML